MSKDRVADLKEQIADLEKRWPAHSVPPGMMALLDELENELTQELKKRRETETFQFQAIGYVENEFQEPINPDILSASSSRIVLAPDLVEGLSGLEPGMTLLVVLLCTFPKATICSNIHVATGVARSAASLPCTAPTVRTP